jgi:hypothetical protein
MFTPIVCALILAVLIISLHYTIVVPSALINRAVHSYSFTCLCLSLSRLLVYVLHIRCTHMIVHVSLPRLIHRDVWDLKVLDVCP